MGFTHTSIMCVMLITGCLAATCSYKQSCQNEHAFELRSTDDATGKGRSEWESKWHYLCFSCFDEAYPLYKGGQGQGVRHPGNGFRVMTTQNIGSLAKPIFTSYSKNVLSLTRRLLSQQTNHKWIKTTNGSLVRSN